VTASLGSTTGAAGGTVTVRVSATDNVGLARVGFRVSNAAGQSIPGLEANVTGRSHEQTFVWPIPATATGNLSIRAFAFDMGGREALSGAMTLSISAAKDSAGPSAQILAPTDGATYPFGDSLPVRVRVADPSGVKSIVLNGVAIRRDSAPTRGWSRSTRPRPSPSRSRRRSACRATPRCCATCWRCPTA
jgi:hypothetical protein